jgi:hypothetical protein
MGMCDNIIIDSFSLWAAIMNQNENKIVVGPKIWFGPSITFTQLMCYQTIGLNYKL